MNYNGIDVSSYEGRPDWARVKSSGVRFAILRVSQLYGIDSSFEHNYRGCREQGIWTGAYRYSYARTASQARGEADEVLSILNGRKLEFPVFYDLEWSEQRKLGKNVITQIAGAFLTRISEAGYRVGIYCNVDWYRNVLDTRALNYDYWLASYPYRDDGRVHESLRPTAGVGWQYSSKGTVPGISGYTDLDLFYTDYGAGEDAPDDSGKSRRLFVGEVTASVLNVRTGPGTEYANLPAYPILKRTNLVDVMDYTQKDREGTDWYYIRIKKGSGYVFGYASSQYIKRV